VIAGEESAAEILALNEALELLEAEDRHRAEVVKLRFFAGLTIEQTADALGISRATATRHWQFARAWLYEAISESDAESRTS
jgi:RNA polymerase sigma factor (sigma-70 family)